MPFKTNQDRRHHIPKQRHRVTNWAACDIALRQRGSLTVWFTEAAIAAGELDHAAADPGVAGSGKALFPSRGELAIGARLRATNFT